MRRVLIASGCGVLVLTSAAVGVSLTDSRGCRPRPAATVQITVKPAADGSAVQQLRDRLAAEQGVARVVFVDKSANYDEAMKIVGRGSPADLVLSAEEMAASFRVYLARPSLAAAKRIRQDYGGNDIVEDVAFNSDAFKAAEHCP